MKQVKFRILPLFISDPHLICPFMQNMRMGPYASRWFSTGRGPSQGNIVTQLLKSSLRAKKRRQNDTPSLKSTPINQ